MKLTPSALYPLFISLFLTHLHQLEAKIPFPPPALPALPLADKQALLKGNLESLLEKQLTQDAKTLEALKQRLEVLKNVNSGSQLEKLKEAHHLRQLIDELEKSLNKASEPLKDPISPSDPSKPPKTLEAPQETIKNILPSTPDSLKKALPQGVDNALSKIF